jgi:hypothetical protein
MYSISDTFARGAAPTAAIDANKSALNALISAADVAHAACVLQRRYAALQAPLPARQRIEQTSRKAAHGQLAMQSCVSGPFDREPGSARELELHRTRAAFLEVDVDEVGAAPSCVDRGAIGRLLVGPR